MFRPTTWLPLAALALLVGLTLWLNQLVQAPVARADGSKRHDPDLFVDNFNAKKLGEDGAVLYTLTAKKMVHYPDDDSAHLESVTLEACEPKQPRMTLTADRGRLEQKGERVWVEGHVVITRDADAKNESARLMTDTMLVLPDEGIARTSSEVTMDSRSSHTVASAMELDNKARTLKLDNVDEWIEGYAQRAEFDDRNDVLKLFNHATVKSNTNEITGEFISYDMNKAVAEVTGAAPGTAPPRSGELAPRVKVKILPAKRAPEEEKGKAGDKPAPAAGLTMQADIRTP